MQELNIFEIDEVSGAKVFGDIAAFMAGASAISFGLATVPTPASPALTGFAVVTGVISAGAWWLDNRT